MSQPNLSYPACMSHTPSPGGNWAPGFKNREEIQARIAELRGRSSAEVLEDVDRKLAALDAFLRHLYPGVLP